jgi:hypothetical protein
MRYFIVTLLTVILSFNTYAADEKKPETKKVCIDEKQKNGKSKQVCKNVKVHKKLEGKAVPGQKK